MQLVEVKPRRRRRTRSRSAQPLEVFTIPQVVTNTIEAAKKEAARLRKIGTASARAKAKEIVKKARKRAEKEARKLGTKAGREFKKQAGPILTAVVVVGGLASLVFIADVIRRWGKKKK